MKSFQYIIDPFTLQKTNVMSKRGKKIIKNYINTYNNYKKKGGRVLFPKEYFGLTTDNYVPKGSPQLNLPKAPCGQYGSELPATSLSDNRCCDQTGGKQKGGRVLFPKEYFGLTTDNYVPKGSPQLNLPKTPCGQYGSELPATSLSDNRCCDQTGGKQKGGNTSCFTDKQITEARDQIQQIHTNINQN